MLEMVLGTAVLLSIVLVASVGLAKLRCGIGGACWLAAGTLVCSVCLFSPALFVQAILLLIGGGVCIAAKARWGTFAAAATLLSAVSLAAPILMVQPNLHRLDTLRAEYPPESLSSRLAYEVPDAPSVSVETSKPGLSAEVEASLAAFETRGSRVGRNHHLERLHSESYRRFVASRGFGFVRMAGVSRGAIELPPEEPIPMPEPPPPPPPEYFRGEDNAGPDARTPVAGNSAGGGTVQEDALASTYRFSLEDFLDVDRMGYVRDVDHVVGFNSHRFRYAPEILDQETWQVTRLELVSLLKHESPVVYVSDHLPAMDELRDAPTRPLDDFELRSLPMLRSERDLVIETRANQIRMLGSLRAGADCLNCHSVQRGELLGAFSYVLDRLSPLPEPGGTENGTDGPI
jgi:hypothetical protein